MQMMLGNGFGFNWQGLYVTSMLDFHSAWRTRAYELSDSLKNTMLLGHYIVTRYRGHYYANAQNLVRRLRRAYDEVLARCDLLLMPTVPMVATPLPEPAAPVEAVLDRAFGMLANTAQFDCTYHPAMSLPCDIVDGLPVGMMLVAKTFDEERSTAPPPRSSAGSTGTRSPHDRPRDRRRRKPRTGAWSGKDQARIPLAAHLLVTPASAGMRMEEFASFSSRSGLLPSVGSDARR